MVKVRRACLVAVLLAVSALALVQSCGGDGGGAADTAGAGGDASGLPDAGVPFDAGVYDAGIVPDAGIVDSGAPPDASSIAVTVQSQELPAGASATAIAISGNPQTVKTDPTAKYLYVGDATAGKVHALFKKSAQGAAAIDFPGPLDLSVNSQTGVVAVTGGNAPKLGLIDPSNANALVTIDIKDDTGDTKARPVMWDEANKEVFVLNPNGNSILAVELTPDPPVVTEVAVGVKPVALDFDKTNRKVVVVNNGDNTVSLVHRPDNTVQTVAVGTSPVAVRFSAIDGAAFVVNNGDNSLSRVDTTGATVAGTIQVGAAPSAIQLDVAKNQFYVANSGDNTVTFIKNGQPVAPPIQVGNKPVAVAIDQSVPIIFTANNVDGSVSIIDYWKNFEVHSFPLTGTGASRIVIDPDTGVLWILNAGDGTVTIVGGYKHK